MSRPTGPRLLFTIFARATHAVTEGGGIEFVQRRDVAEKREVKRVVRTRGIQS